MNTFELIDIAFTAVDEHRPRNLRRYARMVEADDCEECNGTGEVEKNLNGCDVMVECVCRPAHGFRSRDEYEAFEAGVKARGEI